jgi:Metallo-beta-lactamase superfamily
MHNPITAALIAASLWTVAVSTAAQGTPKVPVAVADDPVRSQQCAHGLLAQSLAAHGGEARVAGMAQLQWRAEGPTRNAYQGERAADVDDPRLDGRVDSELAFDFAGGRFRQQTWQRLRGGFDLGLAAIAQGNQVTTLRLAEKTFTKAAAPSAEVAAAQAVDVAARLMPPLLLRRARENLASLRCADGGGAMEFNWDARTRIGLLFDGEFRVSEARVLQPDVLDGQTLVAWRYQGRQEAGGLVLPARVQVVRRSAPLFDLALTDIRVNQPLDAALFAPPADFAEATDGSGPLSLAAVAPGLWEVRGIAGGTYRTPVIEADDQLVVYDAPLSSAVTRQVIALLRSRFPNKAVGTVVLSHFHTDHSGGLPAYADLGATLVVTPGDRAFVERLLAARSVLLPPVSASNTPRPSRLQVVESEAVLPGNAKAIRLRGSPHVAELLLVVHTPSSSLLEADLYSTLTPFNATSAFFADWLERAPMPIERVLGIHHEPVQAKALIDKARSWRAAQPR